jgi:uncharacterized protein
MSAPGDDGISAKEVLSIKEVLAGPHSIEPAPTEIAAFVGFACSGPVNVATDVRSVTEFERTFGGLRGGSDLNHAVSHFFQNGGHRAWIVRVADGGGVNGLTGSRDARTGIYALEAAAIVNILLLPGQSDIGLLTEALAYAAERDAFLIIDLPESVTTVAAAKTWRTQHAGLGHRNAAIYFPRVHEIGAAAGGAYRSLPNSGAVAGVYARTDVTRGVWKAPAGTEASLRGVRLLERALSNAESDKLAAVGINSLRAFPNHGPVVWGARTTDAADPDFKYVPVCRLMLFLRQSLQRGTQWAVFEPNRAKLWDALRESVSAFMFQLWRSGAFAGQKPEQAFYVKCGTDTMTAAEIAEGLVRIEIGFAPLRPAEFVVVTIAQRTAPG